MWEGLKCTGVEGRLEGEDDRESRLCTSRQQKYICDQKPKSTEINSLPRRRLRGGGGGKATSQHHNGRKTICWLSIPFPERFVFCVYIEHVIGFITENPLNY